MISNPPPLAAPGSVEFSQQAYAFTQWMAAAAPQFNDAAQQAQASADIVSSGMPTILASQNFKGNYSALTGALAAPASVFYAGQFWQLLYSLNDVTAHVPGVSPAWQAFTIQTKPTLPTNEVVAAGNLLAEDDAGNSLAVGSLTTGILQAVTATSFHACCIADNVAIFWTVGQDLRMMVVDREGTMVTSPLSLGAVESGTPIASAQLSNGNVALAYRSNTMRVHIRIVNAAGLTIFPQTQISVTQGNAPVSLCALVGGGFVVGNTDGGGSSFEIRDNNGVIVKAATTMNGSSVPLLCPTHSGGFFALPPSGAQQGEVYNALGVRVFANPMVVALDSFGVGVACKSGVIAVAKWATGPSLMLASDASNQTLGGGYGGNCALALPAVAAQEKLSELKNASLTLLGDGTFLAIFSAATTTFEYPRYYVFNEHAQIISSGFLFSEATYADVKTKVIALPHGKNGFSLVWLAANQNIKFANVNSGNLIGISDGQAGSSTKYNVNGVAILGSANMLNVGGSKINYSRQGKRVIV